MGYVISSSEAGTVVTFTASNMFEAQTFSLGQLGSKAGIHGPPTKDSFLEESHDICSNKLTTPIEESVPFSGK